MTIFDHPVELVVTGLISEDGFNMGHGVRFWKSISSSSKNYAVGVTNSSVIILRANLEGNQMNFEISEIIGKFNKSIIQIML